MRRFIASTLLSLAAAAPLAAQFEGTITMKLSMNAAQGPQDVIVKTAVKGGRTASIMSMPSNAGPMAGMEMRTIFDPTTNTSTSLIPIPPGMGAMPGMANAKGIKTVVDLSKVDVQSGRSGATGPAPELKKLGTSQTIAGMSCDDYEMTPDKGTPMKMCVTSALGRFVMPSAGNPMGGRRGGAGASPSWANVFGNKPMYPLKVWSEDGKMAMEVTAVDKSPVSASLFEIPEGYIDMAAMMGGMRPPL